MSRMFDRLEREQLSTGMFALAPGAEYVEILGHVGLDFLIVDMMTTTIGWETAANMVRATYLHDVTPFVRLQAYPWEGKFDPRGSSDGFRALSAGAQGIIMSVDSPEMLSSLMPLATEWHAQTYMWGHPEQGPE